MENIRVKCLKCQEEFIGSRNFYYDRCPNCNEMSQFHFFEIENIPYGYVDYEMELKK
jgi:Zn finger protein HypA/HybF involved in hydrogenase expression